MRAARYTPSLTGQFSLADNPNQLTPSQKTDALHSYRGHGMGISDVYSTKRQNSELIQFVFVFFSFAHYRLSSGATNQKWMLCPAQKVFTSWWLKMYCQRDNRYKTTNLVRPGHVVFQTCPFWGKYLKCLLWFAEDFEISGTGTSCVWKLQTPVKVPIHYQAQSYGWVWSDQLLWKRTNKIAIRIVTPIATDQKRLRCATGSDSGSGP